MNYYNEWDKEKAAWLKELIRAKLIPKGEVDTRDIRQVTGNELKGFTQVHLFAGIGGWSRALWLAGWPAIRPVWTGSCPCQDYSKAGKGEGHGGARHLWPEMLRLVTECGPAIVFGEQVDDAIKYGWIDGVFVDLEALDYACGTAVLPAACVKAPHPRHRIFWLAHAEFANGRTKYETDQNTSRRDRLGRRGGVVRMGEPIRKRSQGKFETGTAARATERARIACGLADAAGAQRKKRTFGQEASGLFSQSTERRVADFWGDWDAIPCADGKTRRVESGTFPLAHGVPARVVRLRGYGDAFVPQVAQKFIESFLEIESEMKCRGSSRIKI